MKNTDTAELRGRCPYMVGSRKGRGERKFSEIEFLDRESGDLAQFRREPFVMLCLLMSLEGFFRFPCLADHHVIVDKAGFK